MTRTVACAGLILALGALGTPRHASAQAMGSILEAPSPMVLPTPMLASLVTLPVQQRGEKSTWLAGILSFFLPYGTGSFYAGNNAHGIRHLIIGGVTTVGAGVGLAAACIDGFSVCDEDDPGYAIAGIFALGYVVNWVWGTITAVNDVKAYNRALVALNIRPEVRMLEPIRVAMPGGTTGQRIGIEVGRLTF